MFINLTWKYKIKLKFLDELLATEIKKLFDLKCCTLKNRKASGVPKPYQFMNFIFQPQKKNKDQ